ncbi:putative sugar transferase EpsL [Kordia antarctica]|uniref:Putative sugar transferase EpsL n=1 Tax=Kordia antarctica TaxID=1218801 RepID=A0A7L4ZLZ0_9FLAO|nr:sugar transferase [Kordia antarctica]QHI37449.1 putative sugar transferase EpsL [Kordia antarctica]
MLTVKQKITKRTFDILMAIIGISLFWWLILLLIIISSIDTKSIGILLQSRIGLHGKKFNIYKIRTMRSDSKIEGSYLAIHNEHRITKIGSALRKWKLDELPQLINVFLGSMSFVGPRPDVAGFADKLSEEDKIILSVKPGITGPASIYFQQEEKILAQKIAPEEYNRNIIWAKKIELNKEYVKSYSFAKDIKYIFQTLISFVV